MFLQNIRFLWGTHLSIIAFGKKLKRWTLEFSWIWWFHDWRGAHLTRLNNEVMKIEEIRMIDLNCFSFPNKWKLILIFKHKLIWHLINFIIETICERMCQLPLKKKKKKTTKQYKLTSMILGWQTAISPSRHGLKYLNCPIRH